MILRIWMRRSETVVQNECEYVRTTKSVYQKWSKRNDIQQKIRESSCTPKKNRLGAFPDITTFYSARFGVRSWNRLRFCVIKAPQVRLSSTCCFLLDLCVQLISNTIHRLMTLAFRYSFGQNSVWGIMFCWASGCWWVDPMDLHLRRKQC